MGKRKDRYYKVKKGPKSFNRRLLASIARTRGRNDDLGTSDITSNNPIGVLGTKNKEEESAATATNLLARNEPVESFKTEPDSDFELVMEEENKSEEEFMIDGNRIVDFKYIWKQLQNISHHNSALGCNLSFLKLTKELRKGFLSRFFFTCQMCEAKLELFNCEEKAKNRTDLNVNDSAVNSFMSIGAGFSELKQVSASLNLPCMSDKLYAKCHTKVSELWELAKEKYMEETVKIEYDLAVLNGDVDENEIPMTTAVFANGCWSKR